MNTQELEGLQPSEIQTWYYGPDDCLVSANKYIDKLLDISADVFAKGQASVVEEDMGGDYCTILTSSVSLPKNRKIRPSIKALFVWCMEISRRSI